MTRNALIGYSGFVGSNLMRRGQFEMPLQFRKFPRDAGTAFPYSRVRRGFRRQVEGESLTRPLIGLPSGN